MFVCFMLAPLFGWLIFSSEAGTEDTTLNCWNQDSSFPAKFTNICSSSNECKYSFSFELDHGKPGLVAERCHSKKHNYNCKEGTFHFRPVAIIRRTQAPHGLLFTYASYQKRGQPASSFPMFHVGKPSVTNSKSGMQLQQWASIPQKKDTTW